MLHVLIIGADVDLLDLLSTHLRQLGHAVHTAASGTEGIATFERVSPHVTVVDLKMPGMSGMEVLKQLREKRAVVVVLTGRADIEDAVRAMQLGAESFLTKPVAMDHLAIAIERAAEKTVLRDRNHDLSVRLSRNLKRRMVRAGAVTALLMASLGFGSAIGGRWSKGPQPAPLRVPLALPDTMVVTNDVPMVWGPVRRASIPSPRQSVQITPNSLLPADAAAGF